MTPRRSEHGDGGRRPPIVYCHPQESWSLTFGAPPAPRWYARPVRDGSASDSMSGDTDLLRRRFLAAVHQWVMVSRCRPVLRGRQQSFARHWPIDQTSLSKVLTGRLAMSHEHLTVLRAAVDDRVFATNAEVRHYLDGVLSAVDETLTLLRPGGGGGAPRPKPFDLLGMELMNAMRGITVSLTPESDTEVASEDALTAAVLPALFASARADDVPADSHDGFTADLAVTLAESPTAFGYVVDGEIIGAISVRPSWVENVAGRGWAEIDGNAVLDIVSEDVKKRPTAITCVAFARYGARPWRDDDTDQSRMDPPEVHLELAAATVDWTSGRPDVTYRRGNAAG